MSFIGSPSRGLDRALLTAVFTVALSELIKYLKRRSTTTTEVICSRAKSKCQEVDVHNGVPSRDESGSSSSMPVRGLRWYTYQSW